MAGTTTAGTALIGAFSRIYVINLKSRADRRQEIGEQFGRLGLSFQHPQIELHEASRFDSAAGYPSIGARGCFHSHLRILTAAAAANLPSILILEDDLDFSHEIETLLPAALARLEETRWSIFYGGYERPCPAADIKTLGISHIGPQEPIRTTHFIALRGDAIAFAASYLNAIDGRPAGSHEGGPMHVDGAYSWFRAAHPQLETWIADPQLGHQRSSRTDIHDLGWKDTMPGVRHLTALARKLLRKK